MVQQRRLNKAFVFVALPIVFALDSASSARFAFASVNHEGVILDSSVMTKLGNQKLEAASRVILDSSENGWKKVAEKKGQLVLLARQLEEGADMVQVEFQVVDVSNGQRRVISTPRIRTMYGELASVKQAGGSAEEVELSMTATKVRYQLD